MKEGILIAFGEIFLKSPGVQKIFKRKLQNNLSFYLKKEGVDFMIFPQRERIFVETENLKKAKSVIKNVFGISWFAESLFFEKENLKEVSEFVAKNYEN
jgi:adenylyl- and sulfurtransferase ThiI